MSNINKAAEIMQEHFFDIHTPEKDAQRTSTHVAQVMYDAGLLMPDLPEPTE